MRFVLNLFFYDIPISWFEIITLIIWISKFVYIRYYISSKKETKMVCPALSKSNAFHPDVLSQDAPSHRTVSFVDFLLWTWLMNREKKKRLFYHRQLLPNTFFWIGKMKKIFIPLFFFFNSDIKQKHIIHYYDIQSRIKGDPKAMDWRDWNKQVKTDLAILCVIFKIFFKKCNHFKNNYFIRKWWYLHSDQKQLHKSKNEKTFAKKQITSTQKTISHYQRIQETGICIYWLVIKKQK